MELFKTVPAYSWLFVYYDLGDKSENLRRINHFEFFLDENARVFKYYVRILALKIGDNLI